MPDSSHIQCPLCGDSVERLVFRFHHESKQEVLEKIKKDHTDWVEGSGACSRCADYCHIEVVINLKREEDYFSQPHPESWHGTLFSTSCNQISLSSDSLHINFYAI
jgi:hypothetical protein